MVRTILFLVILHSCTSLLAQEPQATDCGSNSASREDGRHHPLCSRGLALRFVALLVALGNHGTVGVWAAMRVLHAGFGDIISNLNLGLMAAAELRHKRLLLPTDLMSIKLSEDKAFLKSGWEDHREIQGAELHARA
jgi:hypothetical protein